MTKTKILIFYTSKGLGHKIIAENIAWHLEQAGFQIQLADLLQVENGPLVKYFSIFHTFINTHMLWLWRFFYTNKLFTDLTLPLRLKVAAKHSDKALALIEQADPDMVLVSQGSFSGVVAHLKRTGQYTKPLIVAFSDFHLHRYWLYDETDFYLANLPEQKQQMMSLGISPDKIFVCGITLKPLQKGSIEEIRRKINLLSYQHLVILAAGSLGIGLNVKIIEEFSKHLQAQARKRKLHVVLAVICGSNAQLFRKLTELKLEHVKIMSYYQSMSDFYQVADVFMTKPGGLMVAEALSWRLPILITHCLPGQEEMNLDYLLSKELVMGHVPINFFEKAAWRVMEEIQTGEFRKRLSQNSLVPEVTPVDGHRVIEALKAVNNRTNSLQVKHYQDNLTSES